MKTDVVYYSVTGNTRKIADVIARTVHCEARQAQQDPPAIDADIVFVGGAVYATSDHNLHSSIQLFADRLKASDYRGRIALFATGFKKGNAIGFMRKVFQERGLKTLEESFWCKGQLFLFMKGHPNKNDLEEAAAFAAKIIAS